MQNLDSLSRDELISLLNGVMLDQFTGYMLGSAAMHFYGALPAGKTLLFVDFCNVHACNHKFTMAGTNERWVNAFAQVRADDIVIKWGGDEIVVILDNNDVDGYVNRLVSAMADNDVYAVIAVVKTSESLKETINRADEIVSSRKLWLEETGRKPGRDEPYRCMESYVELAA